MLLCCVLRLDNASELTSVSSLKWFRNVAHWPRVSITEISPPMWYSVRLLNKNHIIENILEGGTDQNHWHMGRLSFWFSLLNLHHSRSHGKRLKFCLCHLNYKFYFVKLCLEVFHCFVHTHFTPLTLFIIGKTGNLMDGDSKPTSFSSHDCPL